MLNTLTKTTTFLRIAGARLRFLAVFAIVGVVVGYWDTIKNYVDKWTRPAAAQVMSDEEYYCAMHPYITRAEPGNCPLCGMPLSGPRKKGAREQLPEGILSRVQLTPQRIALAGLKTTPVEYRALTVNITAVGSLDYDETRVAQLSSRVAGRADELFVKFTGQAVERDKPIYKLYSPEVYTAQREYLLARKRVNELPKDAGAEARDDASAVYNASMQKLVLWGASSTELDKLDHEFDATGKVPTHFTVTSPINGIVVRKNLYEGGYVREGDSPYTIADLSKLWLQAKIYEQDVPLVKVGDEAMVHVDAAANAVRGTVTFMAYQLDPQTRTLAARIEVDNADLRLRPGMFAKATLSKPVVGAAIRPAPATAPTTSPLEQSRVFAAALEPYLKAHTTLVADKADGVSQLLRESLAKLSPLSRDSAFAGDIEAITPPVHKTMGQDLPALRETFKEISLAMIRIGKTAGLPTDGPAIAEFRCPMKKGSWLQTVGDTLNPYDPRGMLGCGTSVSNLPRVDLVPTTRPTQAAAGTILSVPRSAVIDTGDRKIVYVQNAAIEGAYDMREVKLGPLAGDFYPVLSGLHQGEKVVTVGAFLLDAENRLNAPVEHQH